MIPLAGEFRRFLFFVILFSSLSVYGFADCIVNAQVDRNTLIVGDPLNLSITLKHRDGETCLIDEDIDPKRFKLLKKDVKSEQRDGYTIDTYTFTITPLELGEVTIPPLNVRTATPDAGMPDDVAPLSTPEIKIKVEGVINNQEEAKIKDILPPEKVYERTYILLYILISLILGGILLFLLIRYIRKKKRRGDAGSAQKEVQTPPLSPYEEAMVSLKVLEEERLISRMEFKLLYLRLTEILKRFIERFYGFGAQEMTTTELCAYLMDHPQPNLNFESVKGFLQTADLVKFAKFTPPQEVAYGDYNRVRQIIEMAARPSLLATGEKVERK
jgi:hypothetical protein